MFREITPKSIIRWCKPVHLIVIGLVYSGACSGHNILTSLVYESTGLAAVCGHFVASHVQIQRGIGGNYDMFAVKRKTPISLVPKGLVTLRCLHEESLRSFK